MNGIIDALCSGQMNMLLKEFHDNVQQEQGKDTFDWNICMAINLEKFANI